MKADIKKTGFLAAAVILAVSVAMALGSCARSNEMGKLRGHWQLLTIENPARDVEVVDNPRRYISFDEGLVQLTSTDDDTLFAPNWTGTVSGEDPDYIFRFPYDQNPGNEAKIAPWGFDSWETEVHIRTLDGKSLVMEAGDNILTLRRF